MDPSSAIAAPSPLLEVTAPIRVEGESDSQAIFTWMVTNRYLWMLDGRWTDRVEDLVGTGRLLRLVGRRIGWARSHPGHPALDLPDDEPARDFAFARLARFLEMHIVLDEVVNASRPEQELLEPMESPKSPWYSDDS
jgi:hypothetical protein